MTAVLFSELSTFSSIVHQNFVKKSLAYLIYIRQNIFNLQFWLVMLCRPYVSSFLHFKSTNIYFSICKHKISFKKIRWLICGIQICISQLSKLCIVCIVKYAQEYMYNYNMYVYMCVCASCNISLQLLIVNEVIYFLHW